MQPIEDLLSKRNAVFEKNTHDIIVRYKSKLDKILSGLVKVPVEAKWTYITMNSDGSDTIITIHGFLTLQVGQIIFDQNGYEICITEENKESYLQYVKLYLTPTQLDVKSIDEVISELGTVAISPKELNQKEFAEMRDSPRININDTFGQLLSNINISKTRH